MKDEELKSLLSILDGAGAAQNIKEQQGQEVQEGQEVQLTKRNQYAIHKTTTVLTGHLDGKKAQNDFVETIKTYTLRDGTTYTGEMKDGKRHGQGTQTMIIDLGSGNEDYTYTGEWKDGMPHEGTWEYPNGNIYTGEFFEAVPHGQGTLTQIGRAHV